MKVYWFMIFWVVAWSFLAYMYSKRVYVDVNRYENRITIAWAFIIFSVLILFIGLRSGVADTSTYIDIFNSYPTDHLGIGESLKSGDRDQGFKLISIFIKVFISEDFHVWLFILATISSIATMIPLAKYSCDFRISIFMFMTSCSFTWLLNGMRQYLVVSILFGCTILILKNKTILYILIVMLLSTLHGTALIVIPIYFIVRGKAWNKGMYLFLIFIVLAIIFKNQFVEVMNFILEDTSYGEGISVLAQTDDGANIIRIIVEAIPTIIAFIYRKKIKDIATPIINLSINMSVVATGFFIISKIAKSGIMLGRLPIYFSLYNLILLPWLIHNGFNKKEKRIVLYFFTVFYLIFFYYQMNIAWGGLSYESDILNLFV
ncbi:EpsG family protein [Clostridium perfringens]|uniref:EpsG family protein n=1 Tax=Clostridium perfringens TaxID=1502 RepID=UPI002859ED53|nr:EpsG family protein [Clostridium perfringens]ELC8365486.1 EpsG family protein [Clostridium perfringens]